VVVAAAPSGDSNGYDLIVVGAGGAGMAAALFAAIEGLSILLIEKTEYVGGSTALSAGVAWIPMSHLAATVGASDSFEKAAGYLDRVVGNYASEDMRRSFLENGPRAIALLDEHSHVKLRAFAHHPDYISDVEGATLCGRALEPLPFDGRLLGDAFALVRPPIPEFTILGGMMVDRTDIGHLLGATKSWTSFRHVLGIFTRHARDRLSYRRGTRLVMGNALVGRLLHSLIERKVPIWTRTGIDGFKLIDGRIVGLSLACGDMRINVQARFGVILASGGFNRNPELRAKLVTAAPTFPTGAPGQTGEAIVLALAAGARIAERQFENVFWSPVSVRTRRDGSTAVFPHLVLDRGKPGTVVVNATGRRFVNEATSYHLFGRAMILAHEKAPSIPAFLIADRRALEAYGLGMVRPGGYRLKQFLSDGYVVRAYTLRDLARTLGIDPQGLEQTVSRMNDYARSGVDLEFGRGSTAYQRNLGDPKVGPNPTLGAITAPPFYAVRIYPGDIGASAGIVTDTHARVLAGDGTPIEGLYAIGNDMASVMGGTYPGPGITIGPALTFAYLAVRHAAGRARTARLSSD
jgi:succinate dehydrogenase/fumarate reductase flavoprotein subunit